MNIEIPEIPSLPSAQQLAASAAAAAAGPDIELPEVPRLGTPREPRLGAGWRMLLTTLVCMALAGAVALLVDWMERRTAAAERRLLQEQAHLLEVHHG